jgi:tetratricopeptide (TPR) repeat protein
MPSHIFTRLGLWDECIQSNIVATGAARCYAENVGIKGHWDEELHGMDYLVYSYLQKGDNTFARQQCDYLKTIHEVSPLNFKVAYAFAAIPARYALENKLWEEAAVLTPHQAGFPWDKYPWQAGIIHFTRIMGNVRTGNLDAAKTELKALTAINDTLIARKDPYQANLVLVQMKASQAWIALKEKRQQEAVKLMMTAADLEDRTQKHPVTPCEVMPTRELLGDMYLEMNQPEKALAAYEAGLKERPNRFNGLYGAGLAAERCGKVELANAYYQQLTEMTSSVNSNRPELKAAISFLNKQRYQLAQRR